MGDQRSWMAHVDVFVDPDGSETSQAKSYEVISNLLLEKKLRIQDVVLAIGKYLTATDNSIRARGLILLGELLAKLACAPLEAATIQSLSKFFTAKLADWHCLRGALIGSIALLQRSSLIGALEEDDVKDMAKAALENIHVQALVLNDRLLSLELLECFVNRHGVSVSSLGGDLVYGVCAAIEEEKDPRCLLVAFRLVENLAKLFPGPDGPLADCAEDLFDIVSRYFPVSFTPPPGDPRGITRGDLAEALLKVFTSTPLFAPFCIPVLLEKLSSSLQRAKLDSLRYLGSCALSFGPQFISGHVGAIWLAIKAELIPPSVQATSVSTTQDQKDDQIRDQALICLTCCVEAFQKVVEEQSKILAAGDLLKLICEDECVEDLFKSVKNDYTRASKFKEGSGVDLSERVRTEGDMLSMRANQQAQAIGQMLAAAVKASPLSCYVLTKKILEPLILAAGIPSLGLSEDLSPDEPSATDSHQTLQKGSLSVAGLVVTIQILEAARRVAEAAVLSSTSKNPNPKNWLEPVRCVAPMLLMAFSQVTSGQILMENQFRVGVAGLQALASFPAAVSPLTEEQLQQVLSILVETLLNDTTASDLKDNVLGAILAISNLEEQFSPLSDNRDFNVLRIAIPKLLEAVQQAQTLAFLERPLQALASISGPRQIARETVLEGMRDIIGSKFLQELVEASDSDVSQKVVSILECLSKEIIPCCEKGSIDQRAACHVIVDIWIGIQHLSSTDQWIPEKVLSALMEIHRVTVRGCTEAVQEEILSKATSILLDGDIFSFVDKTSLTKEVKQDWTSYPTNLMEGKGWLVALVASVVIGLLPAVVSPRHDRLLEIFVRTSTSETGSLITGAAAQATASLLNKWNAASNGTQSLGGKMDTPDEAIRAAVNNWMVLVNQYLKASTSIADDNDCDAPDKQKVVRGVHALAWTGKGLAMRGHSQVSDIVAIFFMLLEAQKAERENLDSSVEHLGSPNVESMVAISSAESLGIIVKDSSTCLDRTHNAVVRPLFKQRFFTSILSPLQEAVRTAGSHSYRVWLFRAFGHILSGTSHTAVLGEGQKVFPLVLEGLSTLCNYSGDSDLLLSTLLTLSAFLTDENYGRGIVAEYVPATVKRLINLVQYRWMLVIRETALQCLAAIVGLPFIQVFPLKPQVIKATTAALDDKKRSVRKEAVLCCRVWSAIS